MDTENSVNRTRGPRRVGLQRLSGSGKAVVSLNTSETEDPELSTDSPAITTDVESKSSGVSEGLRLDSTSAESMDADVEPHNGEKESKSKIKKEPSEENGSSEDSEEFCGFQPSLSPETKPIRVLTKLLGEAQSELDSENNMSAKEEKMDVDPEIADAKHLVHSITDSGNIKSKRKRRFAGGEIDENGSTSEDDKTKQADGSFEFDNMKLLSEVSSEVTSSNDVTNTNTNDISAKATEEVSSEVTSSATNSPSLSTARQSLKGARQGQESPATVSRRSIIKKTTVDLSSPAFRKPFDYGWKRELVYRNSNESSSRVMADVYYYTPANKKIRSNREVSDHLRGTDLTTDNFTFFKEALGVEDPDKEIIRVAKRVSGVGLGIPKSPQLKKVPTPKAPKPAKEAKEPAATGSPDSSEVKASGPRAAARSFPRIKITASQLMRGSTSTSGPKPKGKKIRSPSDDGDMEMGMLPPNWNQNTTNLLGECPVETSVYGKLLLLRPTSHRLPPPHARFHRGSKGLEPCSLACFGSAMATIPSLQCRLCLCMYHPECVGLAPLSDRLLLSYVCKKCQQDKQDGRLSPPPLTKIVSSPSLGGNVAISDGTRSSPPKLQRIPRPTDTKFMTVQRFMKVQGQEGGVAPKTYAARGQPMVGGVTTWLPPSSTIQVTSNTRGGVTTTSNTASGIATTSTAESGGAGNVQSIAALDGKKYIVVSKHNVLSVSNPSASAGNQDGSGLVLANTSQLIGQANGGEQNVVTAGGQTILPKPATTYVLSSAGHQNPPGVLLVPWVNATPTFGPAQLGNNNNNTAGQATQQLYLVNGPGGNFVVSGMTGQVSGMTGQVSGTTGQVSGMTGQVSGTMGQVSGTTGQVSGTTGTAATTDNCDASGPKKRKREAALEKEAAVPAKRGKKSYDVCEMEQNRMKSFMDTVAVGYSAVLHIFQYLKVKEVSRAAQVCRMWRDLAGHTSLWRIVRMKNSQVDDWEGFVSALVRHKTQTLDMRKMLLPNDPDDIARMWQSFLREISRASSLTRIDLCRCPASVIEALPATCPQLTILNALAIKCSSISLDALSNLADLHELRLKSMTGIHLTSSLDQLKKFTNLRHLALTTFKDLGKAQPEVISYLTNLETLELGECSDFAEQFGNEVIPKLTKLTSLRLEKGQGKSCPTFSLLGGVKELANLIQLELVNFDVKPGFSEALAQCTNIKRLLIIPTYVTQSATTNHMVLTGVTELKESLSHFVWGVTHELLRVTELFIDQCDQQAGTKDVKPAKAVKHPDSIPILKPDKSKAPEWDSADCKSMSSPVGQVEILTLAKLQQVLVKSLPNTKIKILKVPFQSTWRQSISEPNA